LILSEEWRFDYQTARDREWIFGTQGAEARVREAANKHFEIEQVVAVRLTKITKEVIRERRK
jgi:hypothetical protein